MNCLTIPAEMPFISTLARWILAEYGMEAESFTKVLILLPNRRACRGLREAFLECTEGRPLLLPRIHPIGDMDDEALHVAGLMPDIPPAIAETRREFLLAQLVMQFREKQQDMPIEQAMELARELARFMDDAAREGVGFEGLAQLVPEELAAHWQQTLGFLEIISQHWPKILEEEGALDLVEHRNRLLEATAAAWKKSPPDYPVIAAGSTGSQPATAKLLAAIAALPQGRVILPGLDKDMPDSEWDMVAETHPQFVLKQLLGALTCKRNQVTTLLAPQGDAKRMACLRAVLDPPDATAGWAKAALPLEGLACVRVLSADTLMDEARLIAILLREALETPEKTAALITPDRTLARMVAAQMQRFGVMIDDSAGRALADTPPAVFMRLLAQMMASQAAPSDLLSLLRHPFTAVGMEPVQCRALSRRLEKEYLRGIRRAPGLETLCTAVRNDAALLSLLDNLVQRIKAFAGCFAKKRTSLREMLTAHMECAEQLAISDALWAGQAGNELAQALADVLEHADTLGDIVPYEYAGLFDALLATKTYRPQFGLHPRLSILSPMEARLMRFDRVILGSLNEGTWPAAAVADPWMSRPMRGAFGLASPERAIGQSAHDMYLLCAAPEVFLTRARKVEGSPTVASRWLVRLETLVAGLDENAFANMQADAQYDVARARLDVPAEMPALDAPAPKPPLSARPRKLRVTAIDTWLRDPYVIYAKYILKLDALEPLDREPDAADFGTLVHAALDRFTRLYPTALPEHALSELLKCGQAEFAGFADRPAVASLWWPRFESMAAWFVERERERRGAILSEVKGEWTLDVNGKPFTLTTRIDRLEAGKDGLTIADYKTGTVPTAKDVENGMANQLPLEALIVTEGTLAPALERQLPVARVEYWKLAGNPEDCSIDVMVADVEAARQRLAALIAQFDNPDAAYAAQDNPAKLLRYNDYAHLTRRQEWEII